MKKNNTHFEPSLSKHLDDSISNINGDDSSDFEGDESSNAEGDEYSNARGGRRGGGGGGGRRVAVPRGGSFRRGGAVARHRNYVRRNFNRGYGYGYGGYWGFPYAVGVYPETAYYVDVQNPKKLTITKAGLEFLKKNPKGVNGFFLNEIKNGKLFDELKLKDSLQIKDFDRVISWMYGNKFIDTVS